MTSASLLQSYDKISERAEYLQQKNQFYNSALVENKILGIHAKVVTRQLANKLQNSGSYSITVIKTSGVRRKEQAVIGFRYVIYLFIDWGFLS